MNLKQMGILVLTVITFALSVGTFTYRVLNPPPVLATDCTGTGHEVAAFCANQFCEVYFSCADWFCGLMSYGDQECYYTCAQQATADCYIYYFNCCD